MTADDDGTFDALRGGPPDYDPSSGTYRLTIDLSDAPSVSTVVPVALAAITGRDLTALPPLGDVVPTEGLDAILSRPDGFVAFTAEFSYVGHRVSIAADGRLSVAPEPA